MQRGRGRGEAIRQAGRRKCSEAKGKKRGGEMMALSVGSCELVDARLAERLL